MSKPVYFLGIDLGSSAVKITLFDASAGRSIDTVTYPEKEMKIISFLNNSKGPVKINKLQSEVWGYKSKLETHTVETHVYRLRKKILKLIFPASTYLMQAKERMDKEISFLEV